jgi:hypothetical protein
MGELTSIVIRRKMKKGEIKKTDELLFGDLAHHEGTCCDGPRWTDNGAAKSTSSPYYYLPCMYSVLYSVLRPA